MSGMIDPAELYPLKFVPLFREKSWGGRLAQSLPCASGAPKNATIGEILTLSDRPGAQSVIANGELAGKTLGEVTSYYGRALLGQNVELPSAFPLMVKIIDAGKRLDLKVFPDRFTAGKFGDEENSAVWYILKAEPEARIMVGLSGRATRLRLRETLHDEEVANLLQQYSAVPGDAYFLASGILHSTSGGTLILQVQKNSDSCYSLTDWSTDGNLQIEQALASIDFANRVSLRIAGTVDHVSFNRKFSIISQSGLCQMWNLRLVSSWRDDTADSASFHLITALDSPVEIVPGNSEQSFEVEVGETILIPANYGVYNIVPVNLGETSVLKCTV